MWGKKRPLVTTEDVRIKITLWSHFLISFRFPSLDGATFLGQVRFIDISLVTGRLPGTTHSRPFSRGLYRLSRETRSPEIKNLGSNSVLNDALLDNSRDLSKSDGVS